MQYHGAGSALMAIGLFQSLALQSGTLSRIFSETQRSVQTVSYIIKDNKCTMEFRTKLNGAGDRSLTAENMEKSQHTDLNEDMTNESASVACTNIQQ